MATWKCSNPDLTIPSRETVAEEAACQHPAFLCAVGQNRDAQPWVVPDAREGPVPMSMHTHVDSGNSGKGIRLLTGTAHALTLAVRHSAQRSVALYCYAVKKAPARGPTRARPVPAFS